nr:GNAT family N-acetyltransferase [uncultured Undibacterium sp.]
MKICLISEKEDLRTVAKWYFEEWGYLNSSVTAETIYEALLSKLSRNDDFLKLITVHVDGILVAVCDLKYREHRGYPEYEHWLGGIFVKPECRGKGFSAVLITEAKRYVASLNIKSLYLQCEEPNAGLYLKHGFEELHSAVHSGVKTTIFKYNVNT